jgi:hypothetical protein
MIIPMRRGLGFLPSAFGRRKFLLSFILLVSILAWLYSWTGPASRYSVSRQPKPVKDDDSQAVDLAAYPYSLESNITVNLVLATKASDDISWTSRLRIPNLNIIRYVSDDEVSTRLPFFPLSKSTFERKNS